MEQCNNPTKLTVTKGKLFTVIHGDERVDFNENSFKKIERLVYLCSSCNSFHPHVVNIDEYEQHVYNLMTDDLKAHEMRHLNEDHSER